MNDRQFHNDLPLIVTDDQRRVMIPDPDIEPERGSIIMTHGDWGTAYQRFFSDGLWHRVGGGGGRTWDWVLRQRSVRLVYDAPVRPSAEVLRAQQRAGV